MKRWRTYLFAGCCAVVLGACTGNFRDLNDDKSGITDKELEADDNGLGYRLGIVQQGVYFNYDYGKGKNWPFQMIQNLNADMFSGYMHDPKPLQGGSHNSDYNLQDGWNGSMWQFTYSYIMPEIYRLEQTAPEQKPAFYAIAKILKVLVMHRVTDYYGPVIYSHFGDRGNEYVPDSQEEVYGRFFDDLDEAETILTGAVRERGVSEEFGKFDLLLDGSYVSWIRLAASLRMRLAVRVACVLPERAAAEFRKSLEGSYGVIETNPANAAVSTSGTYTNPLGEINRNWNEAVMNASMESIMVGYGDPRLEKYFEPCKSDLVILDGNGNSVTVPLKGVAGVDEDLFVISDEVIEPICDLKTSTLHAKNPRLHSDETLLALSVSSATDPIAKQLVDAADQLRGCDAFFSVILSPTDEKLYRTLGINICCEPKYEQRRYFHK